MIPSGNSLVASLPISSQKLSKASYFCAGAAAVSLWSNYGSAWGWLAAGGAFALSIVQSVKAKQEEQKRRELITDKFCTDMLDWVSECIRFEKNPYSAGVREEMLQVVERLRQDRVVSQEGSEDFRAKFVGTQNAMEHVLSAQKILKTIPIIVAAIHTPQPPTPLCTSVDGRLVRELTAPSMRHNQDILCTIADRAISIRRMLDQVGTILFAVYPRGGFEKRKPEERTVFLGEIERFKDRLIKQELASDTIDPARVGAVYLLTDSDGNQYAFSIKAQQANNPQEKSNWGLWFGKLNHVRVHQRVTDINDYLVTNGGPNILQRFAQACLRAVVR